MRAPVRVGVAGATGAVGLEMLKVLDERRFPARLVRPMASRRDEARSVVFGGAELPVAELTRANLAGLDLVLFATGASVSGEFVPAAVEEGAVCVDNSRAFRMSPGVPLVVPEVNPEAASGHSGVIANPNCSTIQMVLVLKPLHDSAGIKRVVASTYQSVSGTGLSAIRELTEQTKAVLEGRSVTREVYPHRIAFNCIPHIDVFDESGNSREETKMVAEARKILGVADLAVTATCVRVPVFTCHAMSLNVETSADLTPEEARELLSRASGVEVVDDVGSASYPTQVDSDGKNSVFVGRIRRDMSVRHGLWLWVVADNLRKGAALNAVQIAEGLLEV